MYDIAIIGGGPGGYVAAIKASQMGANVVLIEKNELGGTCLNRGCIPTKTMLCATDKINEFKKLSKYGISATLNEIDYKKLSKRKDITVKKLNKGVENLLKSYNITVINAFADVITKNSLKAGDEIIEFKKLIIATGATPSTIPNIEIDGEFILNSDQILEIDNLPESILIVGSGAIGIEWARIFSALGVKTTVLEIADKLSPTCDKDSSNYIETSFKKSRIKSYKSTFIKKIEDKKVYLSNEEIIEPEKILIAAGRKPSLAGLDKLNLELKNGFIKTDKNLKTNIDNIYAIGDVNGIMQLAHTASHQGIKVIEHILENKEININYNSIPFVIYGKPEIASVGQKEDENHKTSIFPLSILGKSIADDEQDGFVKIVADNNIIKGAHIVAKEASSLIHILALAIKEELPINDLEDFVFAHPTYSEGIHEAILGLEGTSIHLPKEIK